MSNPIFSQIIGHEKVCAYFENILTNNRLAHAFLFVGEENLGKTAMAEAIIKEAIGTVNLETHPDVNRISREIDEKTQKQKTNISVSQIREVRERLAMTSLQGGRKAVLIEEADKMNLPAANALLKTLEEPKGETIMILRAAHLDGVPATIASRCQIIRFYQVAAPLIEHSLRERGLGADEAKKIAAWSGGRPGIAMRLIKDSEYKAQWEVANDSFLELLRQNLPERLAYAGQILPKDDINKARTLEKQLDSWENAIYGFWHQSLGLADSANGLAAEAVGGKTAADWHRVLRAIQQARRAAAHNANPQLVLEHVILSI